MIITPESAKYLAELSDAIEHGARIDMAEPMLCPECDAESSEYGLSSGADHLIMLDAKGARFIAIACEGFHFAALLIDEAAGRGATMIVEREGDGSDHRPPYFPYFS